MSTEHHPHSIAPLPLSNVSPGVASQRTGFAIFSSQWRMKSYSVLALTLILIALFSASCTRHNKENGEMEKAYGMLDDEIKNAGVYEDLKERRLDSLRNLLPSGAATRKSEALPLYKQLIEEFNAYRADSALHYVNLGLATRQAASDSLTRTTLLLKKADIYAHAGLFSDALSIMASIPAATLTPELKELYFANYCSLYQYMIEYSTDFDPLHDKEYIALRQAATDSLLALTDSLSFNYLVYGMPQLANNGEPSRAITKLQEHLSEYQPGSREYSILASILAYSHKQAGNDSEYRKYIVQSAISDIRGAVKENMSFREIATYMFEDGDVNRANLYLKKSIADANFFSARMRNAQSLKMLPLIDETYSAQQQQLQHRLKLLIIGIATLAIGLIIALIFIRKQYSRLKIANQGIEAANHQLAHLSQELQLSNSELEQRNLLLNRANQVKEQYTALFMQLTSSAIASLQNHNHALRVLANKGFSKEALQRKLDSTEFIDTAFKEFYTRFDEAILSIYPDFAAKANRLFPPDRQIILKPNEILNTELRILALIRLGVTESQKIAEMLRCSLTTIYTYRSKLRRRSKNPATFEDDLMKLE